jgi:branched-chain amino acid aminotransferase
MKLIWQDGRIAPDADVVLPQLQSWGAFTTAGAENGSVLMWPEHEARLRHSAEVLGGSDAVLLPYLTDIESLLSENHVDGAGVVRVVAWRAGADDRWQVQASARCEPELGPERPAVRLQTIIWPGAPPFAGHKSLARLPWDHARQTAQKRGADDALLVTEGDELLETSVANVMCRFGREVFTPVAPQQCLPGIMRAWLMEALPKAGFKVTERTVHLDDALGADELWVLNAVIGIQRVASVDDRRWSDWSGWEDVKTLRVPAPGWPK